MQNTLEPGPRRALRGGLETKLAARYVTRRCKHFEH